MKQRILRSLKEKRGITLIALVITIIVLLILAGITLSMVLGPNGIIGRAKEAGEKQEEASAKEKILLALNDWTIEKYAGSQDFKTFLEGKFGASNVIDNTDGTYTIKIDDQEFLIGTDGNIETVKGISLDKSTLKLELKDGEEVTGEITATLRKIEGEIVWSKTDTDNSVVTMVANGNKATIKAVAKGETTITATCGDYSKTCTVKVTEPVTLEIGSYVQYNVEYEDMYSGQTYGATNGWRYLGKDDAGNNLIVSTGIPAILYYHYDGTNGTWWDPDTAKNTNVRATNGMRNNFENIPFNFQASGTSVSTKNTGIFRKVGATTSGVLPATAFRANGVNVLGVHNLTLEEMNRAMNRAENSTLSGFKDLTGTATGLFDMQDLTGYTANYFYWLASPYAGNYDYVRSVDFYNYDVNYDNFDDDIGVRPVVVLSTEFPLTPVE